MTRYATGAYAAWRTHVALLVAELLPDAEPAVLADLLLAPLSAGLQVHLVDERGVPRRRARRAARPRGAGGGQPAGGAGQA